MTLDQSFVINKLGLVDQYRGQLKEFLEASDSEILSSTERRLAIERAFQLLVDAMVDINQHLIRGFENEIPDDLQSTFYPLGEKGILPEDFARKLAPVVGARNRLVHQYEDFDEELFLRNLRTNFSNFEEYQEHIKKYLSRL